MSSLLQLVVNELVLRAPLALPVVFEKGAITFSYGSLLLREQERQKAQEDKLYEHMPEDVK